MGKIGLYLIIGLVSMGSLTGIYYSWRKGIEREAMMAYNQKQLEQNLKDQERLKQQLADINKKQEEFIKKNKEDKKRFGKKIDGIKNIIDSDGVDDRPASDVLKKTFEELNKVPK